MESLTICKGCKKEKQDDGLKRCEKCREYRRIWYEKNKEKENEQSRKYHERNKGEINKRHIAYNKEHSQELKEYRNNPIVKERKNKTTKEWQKLNRDKINARKRDLRKHPKRRIDNAISQALRHHMSLNVLAKKYISWKDLVGYSVEELMKHLESKFKEGMSWDNYGTYWHIDHIKPKSWFIYESTEDIAFKECWALENLQPLEAKENIKKGNRYEG